MTRGLIVEPYGRRNRQSGTRGGAARALSTSSHTTRKPACHAPRRWARPHGRLPATRRPPMSWCSSVGGGELCRLCASIFGLVSARGGSTAAAASLERAPNKPPEPMISPAWGRARAFGFGGARAICGLKPTGERASELGKVGPTQSEKRFNLSMGSFSPLAQQSLSLARSRQARQKRANGTAQTKRARELASSSSNERNTNKTSSH